MRDARGHPHRGKFKHTCMSFKLYRQVVHIYGVLGAQKGNFLKMDPRVGKSGNTGLTFSCGQLILIVSEMMMS